MTTQPNIVIISCDQLRSFEIGCYGNPVIRTPHMDRLAAEGVRFDAACSNNPLCTPSRANLLSGQYSRTCNGMTGNVGEPDSFRRCFPNPMLPEVLRQAGYSTALVGSWHVQPGPDLCGVDHFVVPLVNNKYFGQSYYVNSMVPSPTDGWSWDFEMNNARAWITNHRDRPFFLYFNIDPPHMPLGEAPEKYTAMYSPADVPLRPNVHDVWFDEPNPSEKWPAEKWFKVYLGDDYYEKLCLPATGRLPASFGLRELTALYYGMVTLVDDQLGKLMQALADAGIADNTIVLFTSDHGDNLGSHGLWNKLYLTEESIRIPMIYRWPAAVKPHVAGRQVTSRIDIMPTILGLLGLPLPHYVQGTDVSPVIRGEAETVGENAAFIESVEGGFGIRTRDHVYGIKVRDVSLYGHKPENDEIIDDRYLFYDLRSDPYELRNLARTGEQRGVADELRERVIRWHRTTPWLK
ncbi:MAG TPA: sulfatase-like hydrolase/transferase [Planctomycetota bacterium]|nr:sulfatase-like hydrolase/transferase [Planctomycetota bacterium]